MLQYELAIGPSIGKAVTTLKWNLMLGPYKVNHQLFQFISLRGGYLWSSALLHPTFSVQFEPQGPGCQ